MKKIILIAFLLVSSVAFGNSQLITDQSKSVRNISEYGSNCLGPGKIPERTVRRGSYKNVYELITCEPAFSTLASLVVEADLVDVFDDKGIAFFPPVNEAFPDKDSAEYRDLISDKKILRRLILCHKVEGTKTFFAIENTTVRNKKFLMECGAELKIVQFENIGPTLIFDQVWSFSDGEPILVGNWSFFNSYDEKMADSWYMYKSSTYRLKNGGAVRAVGSLFLNI